MKTLFFFRYFIPFIHYIDDVILAAFTAGVTGEAILTLSGGELTQNEGEITGNNVYDLILKLLLPLITGVAVTQLNKMFDRRNKKK